MPHVTFEGNTYPLNEAETILDGLERHGVPVSSSCRAGVCHSCMMKATEGTVPEAAQRGLRPTQRAQNLFLACSCVPKEDLTIERPGEANHVWDTHVVDIQPLNERTVALRIALPDGFDYRPGQFVNLLRPGNVVRSYSLASVPEVDDTLDLHIAHMPGGLMSDWACNEARPGDALQLTGPLGSCFYLSDQPAQPLFLLGTGTGLAPLYGILRDALHQGHTGPIYLFHGALTEAGLYLYDELRALAAAHANVTYVPAALEGGQREGVQTGDLAQVALGHCPDLSGHRVYLCGHPDLVKAMQKKCFLSGAAMADILADAFLPAAK